ncbi:MAG: RIP metalloprotease RseP [Pseudomonadota bacterium]|nr:RIP metalloprotease RseP [Pseudomonadota bacterium]
MPDILHSIWHYVIPFIVVISVVVFVHEFGHYWVARRCGVKIVTFSIGFGAEIFGWNDRHGTRWQVSWLPFGGYVKMYGDADPASTPDETVHQMTDDERKVAFFHQSIGKRMAIVAAGPASNYLFAILVLALLFVIKGQPYTPPDVGGVNAAGPAAAAGIKPGDHIVAIDGKPIERFEDIKRIVAFNSGTPLSIDIERAGAPLHFSVTPAMLDVPEKTGGDDKSRMLGISSDKLKYRKRSVLQAVQQAGIETWDITALSLKAIGQMIAGTRGAEGLGGPLRIAEMSSKVAEDGVASLIRFLAMISISLGFINLFPVPLLDGGHLAFYVAEWIKGGPLPPKVQDAGMRVGIALVLSLMVFATWNDLVHLKVVSYVRSFF